MKVFQIDRKIKILCLVYFMVAQSSMMARATSDSFLLKYFQPESIPLMIMAAASLSIVLALFTTYLCGRFQAFGAMRIATAGIVVTLLAMVCVVYLFGNKGETKPIYVFAYMLCETIVILPMVLFWGMAVGVLNPTESKRWMGLIGAAGTIGCILAGFTISIVSKQEFVNELSLGMVALVLMVVSMILIARADLFKIKDDEQKPESGKPIGVLGKLLVLISSKQSILMTWLVVFSAIVLSLVDINFKFEVRKDYSEDLYDFFGQFYTYTSCAQLILQLFIVKAILTRGGVMAAISILPILLLLTAVGAVLFQNQDAIYVGKFITQVVFFTIEYVGLQMLFLSVKKKLRGQMNSAVDGLTRPATIATISLIITSSLAWWQEGSEGDIVLRLNLIIIVLCLCWLFVAFLNYKQYLKSLVTMIGASISVPKSLGSQNSSDDTPATFLPHPIIPRNYSELETFITKISGENERFNAVQEYFEKTNPIDFGRKNKGFAKKEFILLLRACESCSLFENRIQSTSEFRILRSALQDLVEQKIEVLTTILSHLDSTINFFKIVDCLKAKDANVKSEAIEVLKGVLGPKNTDTFVNLITPAMREQDQESVGVERILKQFSTESNPSIVKGVLLTLSKETFAQGKAFITSCFNHHDYAVRESALKAFLSLEAEPSEIRKYCEILSDDNSSIISTIAKEKIQSILNP
ncbi:MAG: hypothetical protein HOH60_02745 [Opitutae bacterium]|nr:hypothetical protein [Opitutae bacterium]